MKVITFSKYFLKGHPRQGEPTFFVEKILHSVFMPKYKPMKKVGYPPKFHTIREGSRWKVGDKFSARIWKDKPYRSKQKEFAQLEVKKVFDFNVDENGIIAINGSYIEEGVEERLAMNDGLDLDDFFDWIIMPCYKKAKQFNGQIICWDENIKY